MLIKEYTAFTESEILALYGSVGWTAYTASPETLQKSFENSLLVLAAYEEDTLLGLIRTVGDGHSIIYVQDLLVFPEFQRRGIGTALLHEVLERFSHVRQIVLSTDNEERTLEFYKSMGFTPLEDIGCRGFMLIK